MQYLFMLYLDETQWNKMTSAEQQQGVAAYRAYTEALQAASALKGTNRLQPTNTATTVRVSNGKSQVIDGPYVDLKEQLAGYYLIEAADMDAALSWAARCPTASHGAVEVRPIWPMQATATAY
jgi:hypothetical protein